MEYPRVDQGNVPGAAAPFSRPIARSQLNETWEICDLAQAGALSRPTTEPCGDSGKYCRRRHLVKSAFGPSDMLHREPRLGKGALW